MIALAEGPNEISFALPGVDAFLLKSSLISRVGEMVALAVHGRQAYPVPSMHRGLQADLGEPRFSSTLTAKRWPSPAPSQTC